jgi:hypothetical protein
MPRRLLLLTILVLGLAFVPPQPARAETIGAMRFIGTWNVGAGIAYPCVGSPGWPAIDLTKCPIVSSGNTVSAVLSGTGLGTIANSPTKAQKATTVEGPIWTFNAAGIIAGWCWLSSGYATGSLTVSLNLGTKQPPPPQSPKVRTFSVSWTEIAQKLFLTGTTNKGETLIGYFEFVADTVSGSSCTNKNAKNFIMAGELLVLRAL